MSRLTHRILDIATSTTPDAIAATLGMRALTFREVDHATSAMAHTLQSIGIGRGQRVMLQAETTLDHLALFFATQRLGAAFVPLVPTLSVEETARIAAYIRPSLVAVDPARHTVAEALASSGVPVATTGSDGAPTPYVDLDRLAADASDAPLPQTGVGEDDVHAIFLTSGSTGQPKGVMLSHKASWQRSMNGGSRAVACGGGGELMTFPLYHWAGWNYVMENWAHRRAAHFVPRLDGPSMGQAIERWRPAYVYCIPAVWERLLDPAMRFDASSVRFVGSGTSRFDPVLLDRIKARFPQAARTVYYGSTEFGGAITLHDNEIEKRPGAVGLPYAGCEARIVDGELRLRSLSMMDGYFELPEQTSAVFDQDGWYMTGDLVERDADGFFYVTGRRREVIRSGGETIAPAEVELALFGLPGVREVAVVGLPDPVWGEVVCAAFVVEDGHALPSIEILRGHVGNSLAPFKHPRKIVQVDMLPRTPATGQIMRARVKDTVLSLS
ncbi:class I adenylate-forming enzyme family protein [Corticibacterium sp. UT-5YL-CI-8]|nr:class I adenylate-forming enzyme family protein [Tianweitania sp. UT-5YL-CI-8]